MQCVKCHSPRIIRFVDGFGDARVFCKTCQESMLIEDALLTLSQKNVWDFNQSTIPRRWEYDRVRKNGGFVNTR
ncbi:MAG: hypothetical protein ISS48_04005 [Candidatus Aenigmarchaeota archaeon]|nr:hypothetical protein [Candidatus Aenigmarchaeota archaeon]